MVGMGEHDELENRYTPLFEAMLSKSGIVLGYRRDRAGIDTGLHLFAQGTKPTPKGDDRSYWRPLASGVGFQLKGGQETAVWGEKCRQTQEFRASGKRHPERSLF